MPNYDNCIKPEVMKTLIKGTIILVIFSLFLDIVPSKFINYIIFVILWYILLSTYMLWKRMHKYCINEGHIIIRGLIGVRSVNASEIIDCFISQGILAKHFNCGSIYLVLQDNKVIIIRDIPQPNTYYSILCKNLSNRNST
ncbi:hypothetical protein VMUT_2187 [Vulcanisaeta moutnovskia 768-28]|uniref:YdbS-like PH domain-containing protein n=1 Tax=Vulcanisaeta moutnovskia (strain 768-28) TaxID=985053 RepID=F0QXG8_VULM7|nr:PH domain-containing protein [Vulcanisaeta moutnovskia]ADY02383.1 hypothetical protein VMUT_2187 [Vulcanisaeta moutnovskia 768-28]